MIKKSYAYLTLDQYAQYLHRIMMQELEQELLQKFCGVWHGRKSADPAVPMPTPAEDKERIIKRLTQICETEYTIGDTDKIEDDIHDLAYAVLQVLRQDEVAVFRGKHQLVQTSAGFEFMCTLCQRVWSSREISTMILHPRDQPCPAAIS